MRQSLPTRSKRDKVALVSLHSEVVHRRTCWVDRGKPRLRNDRCSETVQDESINRANSNAVRIMTTKSVAAATQHHTMQDDGRSSDDQKEQLLLLALEFVSEIAGAVDLA